jgi:proteasome accessory factor C
VDRIRQLQVVDEEFERPTGIPEPGVTYSPSDDDVMARIALSPQAAWVLDYYPVEVLKETKATTEILFHSPDAEIPARLLLRLGDGAKLLEGDEVRARVAAMGRALKDRYR